MPSNLTLEDRVGNQLERMGIPRDADGSNVDALRTWLREKFEGGVVSMSGGSWGAEAANLTPDERAKAFLAFVWEGARYAYTAPAALIDGGPVRTVTNALTGKRRTVFKWRLLWPIVLSTAQGGLVRVRRWIDRRVRGVRNPYLP